MRRVNLVVLWVLPILFVIPLMSSDEDGEARKIVQKMDELYRSSSSEALMEMNIVTPHWKRTLKMNFWSMGMDKSFIKILSPRKEMGIATLKIGNEMWNYLPKTNKVMKIPPSMMMGSWMGSDFTNDDLVKEYTFMEDYTFSFTNIPQPEEGTLYVKCVPKPGRPIIWGHLVIAVRSKDYIPKWQRYYDEKGAIVREMLFKDVRQFGEKTIPAIMELVNLKKKGQKTTVRYLEARFDLAIKKGTFSLRNLRSR